MDRAADEPPASSRLRAGPLTTARRAPPRSHPDYPSRTARWGSGGSSFSWSRRRAGGESIAGLRDRSRSGLRTGCRSRARRARLHLRARAGDVELPTQRAHAIAAADGGATVELGFAELNMAPSGRYDLVVSEGRPSSWPGRDVRPFGSLLHELGPRCDESGIVASAHRPALGCANRRCQARVTPQARRQWPPTPDHTMCACIAPRRPRQRRLDRDPHLRAPRPASAQVRFRKR